MKSNSQLLLIELERELDRVHLAHTLPTSYCEHALQLLRSRIERLEGQLAGYSFPTKQEEAGFLASIRPWLATRLLYYQEVSTIEQHRPPGSGKTVRNYYKSALEKRRTPPDASNRQTRHQLLSLDDFKEASLPANDLIRLYLQYELSKLDAGTLYVPIPIDNVPDRTNGDDTS